MELQLFSQQFLCTKTVVLPISSSATAAVAPPIFSLEPMVPQEVGFLHTLPGLSSEGLAWVESWLLQFCRHHSVLLALCLGTDCSTVIILVEPSVLPFWNRPFW